MPQGMNKIWNEKIELPRCRCWGGRTAPIDSVRSECEALPSIAAFQIRGGSRLRAPRCGRESGKACIFCSNLPLPIAPGSAKPRARKLLEIQ